MRAGSSRRASTTQLEQALSLFLSLAVTFVGAGAMLILKEFLKGIGSELGKKLVAHYTQREAKPKSQSMGPRVPIVVVLENPPYAPTPILIPQLVVEA